MADLRNGAWTVNTKTALRKARYLVSLVLLAAIPAVTFLAWASSVREHQEFEAAEAELVADATAALVERSLHERLRQADFVKMLTEQGMLRRSDEFERVASHALGSLSGFIALNRIDADRTIVQVVPWEPNAPALGRRVGASPEVVALLDEAESTGSTRATRLVNLFQGGTGVAIYLPIRMGGQHVGFINAVLDVDVIMQGLQHRLPVGLQVKLSEPDAQLVPYAPLDQYLSVTRSVMMLNRVWELRIGVPAGATHETLIVTQTVTAIAIFAAVLALLYISARERRLAEIERQRLRNAIDAVPGAFVMFDRNGRLTVANAAALSGQWQFDPSSLVSKAERRWADLAPAVDAGLHGADKRQGTAEPAFVPAPSDREIRLRDGRWARLLESSTSEGGYILLGLDVTSAKAIQEERDQLNRTFKSILDHAPFAFVIKGPDLKYRLTNEKFVQWYSPLGADGTGATFEEVTGSLDDEVTSGDSAVLASGTAVQFESAFTGKDASISRVRVITFPLRDQNGDISALAKIVVDITAAHNAAEAAALHRARLLDAIESLPASFLMFDREERLIIANEEGLRRFGSPPKVSLGMTAEALARIAVSEGYMEGPEPFEERVRRRLAAFRAGDGASEYRAKDGRWFYIIDYKTKEGGRIALRLDITERRLADAELRVVNERFRAILDNAPLAIFIKDRELRYQLTNRQFDEWYVAAGETALGQRYDEFGPEDRTEAVDEVDRAVLAHGLPIEQEREFTGLGPRTTDVRIVKFPIRSAQGEIVGIGGVISDSTARKRAETQRQAAEAELRSIMDHTVDGLITFDDRGVVTTFNKRAEAIFGHRTAEIVGLNVSGLFGRDHALDQGRFIRAHIEGGLQEATGALRELEAVRKDGTTFPVEVAVGELPSARGRRRFVATLRDISARKAMENRLQQSQRIEALGRLTGGVAHDFNNILAAIALNLEMLEPFISGSPAARARLETATRATFRGRSLTKQLLSVAGRQALTPERVEVDALVEDIGQLIATTLGDTHTLTCTIQDRGLAVLADAGNLESVILNLVLNARDALPGGGSVRLSVSRAQGQAGGASTDLVRITIADEGIGMPPEILERALEPFFTTKGVGKGSGLGLSMVAGFAKQSGGTLEIESKPGQGTRVHLCLPVAPAQSEATGLLPPARPALRPGLRVLLVEDEALVRDSLSAQLEAAGCIVVRASTADQAAALAAEGLDVDVVLTDVIMPGSHSGAWLVEHLRKLKPVPAVLMSGFVGDPALRDAISRLACPFLKKPFTNSELVAALTEAMESAVSAAAC